MHCEKCADLFHNGPEVCKRKRFFLCFLRGIQGCHMKADDLPFPKMWWFFILQFKPELLLLKVGSNLRNFFGKVAVSKKKRHGHIFLFCASILNQRGPNMEVKGSRQL